MHDKSVENIKKQANRHLERIDEIMTELDDLGSDYVFGKEGVRLIDLDKLYSEFKDRIKKLKFLYKFANEKGD